jgi:lipopolysaccharide export LptBFGC system permease protein LptF
MLDNRRRVILSRAYFSEILRHLLLVLAGVVFLLALGAAVRASSTAQGAPIWLALALVPLIVGNALPYFFPVTLMTAVVLTYGRMAADREEIALRAAGMHPMRMMIPALLAGGLVGLLSYPISSAVMPEVYREMRTLFIRSRVAALENTNPGANEFHFKGLHLVWADRDPDGAFRDVVVAVQQGTKVQQKDKDGSRGSAQHGGIRLRADRATMDVRGDELIFRFDHLRTLSDQVEESPWQASNSETTWLTVDLASLLSQRGTEPLRPKALSSGLLLELMDTGEYLGKPIPADILRKVELVFWQRWASALGAIPVAMLGALIGWRLRRGGFMTGFAAALLVLLVVDYPLHFLGEGLMRAGKMAPPVAAWLPISGLLLVVGAMIWRGRKA